MSADDSSSGTPEFPEPGVEEPVTFSEALDEETEKGPHVVELDPPNLRTARFGILGELYRLYRHRQKRRKLTSKGYVQWYLVNGTFPRPKYVKPKLNGGGIPEYEYGGDKYLFPREGLLPSEQEGMWTVVHKEGEIDPINLREPSVGAISPDQLEEYLTGRLAASAPSFWDRLDIDAKDAVMYAVALIIFLGVVQQYL